MANKSEQTFQRILEELDQVPDEKKDSEDYLPRNLLFYSWLLQQGSSKDIDRTILLDLVGHSISNAANRYLRNMAIAGIINGDDPRFTLSKEMSNVIHKYFDNADNHYFITHNVPFFNQVTGLDLVRYLGLIDKPLESLGKLIADAFRMALPGVTTKEIKDVDIDIEMYLISGPVLVSDEPLWSFILVVYPRRIALSGDRVDHIVMNTAIVREKLGDLEVMLIAPAVDDMKDVQRLNRLRRIHYMWSLSALRFFHLLKGLIDEVGVNNQSRVAEEFMAIFVPQQSAAMAAHVAIEELKKKLN